MLSSEFVATRVTAAQSIGGIEGQAVTDILIGLLRDKDAQVQAAAARLLGYRNDERAVAPLMKFLKSDPTYGGEKAATSLGILGDAGVIESLKPLLESSRLDVKVHAAVSLARLNDSSGLNQMRVWINSRDRTQRSTLYYALSGAASSSLTRPKSRIRNPEVLAFIREQLSSHTDRSVRLYMALALQGQQDQTNIQALKAATNDKGPGVRDNALHALFYCDKQQGRVAAIEALDDKAENMQRKALYLLGEVANESDVDLIAAKLQSPAESVRLVAISALSKFPKSLVAERLKAAESSKSSPRVRAKARAVLSELSD